MLIIATATAVRTHNYCRDVPAERLYNNSFAVINVSTAIMLITIILKQGLQQFLLWLIGSNKSRVR